MKRAIKDTQHAFHTIRFWLFELSGIAGLTILVLLWQPEWADKGRNMTVYQVLVPIGGVFGGLSFLFLLSIVMAIVRQSMTVMVTNIVTQVSVQNNVAVLIPYPTPIVVSDIANGPKTLGYLLNRGRELETLVQQSDVWKYLPDQARYILSDDGFVIQKEALKYGGWNAALAYRRVVLARISQIRLN